MEDKKLDKNGLMRVWLKIWTLLKLLVGDVDVDGKGDLQTQIDKLDNRVEECFQSASDGKGLVANAISGKGVPTKATDSFATMAGNISVIETGTDTSDASAVASNILEGRTAYVKDGRVTGTMTNEGAWTGETTGSGNVLIPEGYHNGRGYVSGSGAYNKGMSDADARANANSKNYKTGYDAGVSATKVGTALAEDVLVGKTFTNSNAVGANGGMPERAAVTVEATNVTQDDTYTYFEMPEGHYNENSKVRTKNSNIASAFDNRCMCCGVNSESHKWEVVWADQGVVYTSARLVDTNLSAMRFIITYESTYAICRVIARKKGVFKFGSVSFGVNNPSIPLTENVVDNGADILNIRLDVNSAAPASFYCEFVR